MTATQVTVQSEAKLIAERQSGYHVPLPVSTYEFESVISTSLLCGTGRSQYH